ncbi:hypothetical protein [uncultured Campylobacter sp.]|uniref:hypothetical protein n=1 Tax=uncultured Campylobacter sp. TaxID=218934 RepID=UPI0026232612|nr:hypothetical protein [uncultured Campylobacter sp.]
MREFILYIDEAEYGVYEEGFTMWTQKDDAERLDEYMFAKICTKSDKLMGFLMYLLAMRLLREPKMMKLCKKSVSLKCLYTILSKRNLGAHL